MEYCNMWLSLIGTEVKKDKDDIMDVFVKREAVFIQIA